MSAADRQRAIHHAVTQLLMAASAKALEVDGAAESVAMISGHEVVCRISAPVKGTCRTYWRLNGDRYQGRTLLRFLLAEAAREVPQ